MTFATLALGRIRFDVVTITDDRGGRELVKLAAQQYYEQEVVASWHAKAAALKKSAEDFVASAVVRTHEEVLREWTNASRRIRGPRPKPVDQVTANGQIHKVAAGTAQAFLLQESKRLFPHPSPAQAPQPFENWFFSNRKEKRTWRAEFVTEAERRAVNLGADATLDRPFPVQAVLRILNRLERDGWSLVHISEDHGLYQGADSPDEAYLTRVRYLLSHTA